MYQSIWTVGFIIINLAANFFNYVSAIGYTCHTSETSIQPTLDTRSDCFECTAMIMYYKGKPDLVVRKCMEMPDTCQEMFSLNGFDAMEIQCCKGNRCNGEINFASFDVSGKPIQGGSTTYSMPEASPTTTRIPPTYSYEPYPASRSQSTARPNYGWKPELVPNKNQQQMNNIWNGNRNNLEPNSQPQKEVVPMSAGAAQGSFKPVMFVLSSLLSLSIHLTRYFW